VVSWSARHNRHQKFRVDPRLHFILLIPAFEVKTAEARSVLPHEIDRLRAVESCANACAITAALRAAVMRICAECGATICTSLFEHSLFHSSNESSPRVRRRAPLGGFLSGSGSTVACVTLRSPEEVANAMREASGLDDAEIRIIRADNDGAQIVVSVLNSDAPVA
jgi:homoserine kinase